MRLTVLSRLTTGLLLSVFLAGPALAASKGSSPVGPNTPLGSVVRQARPKPMSPLVRIPKRVARTLPTLPTEPLPPMKLELQPLAAPAPAPTDISPTLPDYRTYSASERGPIDERLKQAYLEAKISWGNGTRQGAFVVQSPKRYLPFDAESAVHWTAEMFEHPGSVSAEVLAKPVHFVPRTTYRNDDQILQHLPQVTQVLGKKIVIVESRNNHTYYSATDDPTLPLFHVKLPLPYYPPVVVGESSASRAAADTAKANLPGAIQVTVSQGKNPNATKIFLPETLEDTSHLEGMDALRLALAREHTATLPSAEEYGSVPGKGYLLVGPPGTGKSKSAMLVAEKLGRPLYTLHGSDFGGMYESQSEGNMAAILKGFEGKKVVILIDEVEKMFPSDAKKPHTNGTQELVLAELLPFMARNKDVFFVFAANSVELPSALVRSGRISGTFYVGLPERSTRASIVDTTLAMRGWKANAHDLARVADATAGYSGAELEEIVNAAIKAAGHRSQNTKPPTGQDLLDAVTDHPPLSLTKKAEYDAMRNWAREVNAKDAAGKRSDSILPKGGIVTVEPVTKGLEQLGGFAKFKGWLGERAALARLKERDGSAGKGTLLVGFPGTGKTMAAQIAASTLKRPLLRLSFGAFLNGDPAGAVRQAIREIKDAGRVVLLLDELEKMLQIRELPSMGPVMSELLDFLEKQRDAFVVATANDVSHVPSEFTRRGRFDRTFVVDLPTHNERIGVFQALLNQQPRKYLAVYHRDLDALAASSRGFTAAEIRGAIEDAIGTARVGRRAANVDDIIAKLRDTKSMAMKLGPALAQKREELHQMGDPVSDEPPEDLLDQTRNPIGFLP